jgi:hypothetical protein
MLEVILLGLVLIVPIVWLLGVLAEVHRAALATNAAAREIGWELVRGGDGSTVARTATTAFADQGLDVRLVEIDWEGVAEPDRAIQVSVAYPVRMASFPLLGRLSSPVLSVHAVHRAHVPAHRSDP